MLTDHEFVCNEMIRKNTAQAFENICKLWNNVVAAAADFMWEQRNENHFEFFGIDVIVDSNNKSWLIEINRYRTTFGNNEVLFYTCISCNLSNIS